MLALVYHLGEGLELEEVVLPSIPRGAGHQGNGWNYIGSDARIIKGEEEATIGIVLGHEVAGVVDAIDPHRGVFRLEIL